MINKLYELLGFQEKKMNYDREGEAVVTSTTWGSKNLDSFPSTFANHIKHGFTNSIVYSCVTAKSLSALQVSLKAYEGTKQDFKLLDSDNEFSKLFMFPNPSFSWVEFQQLMSLYLDLDGNIFIYKSKDNPNQKEVNELYLLQPNKVVVVQGSEETKGYLYKPEPDKKAIPFLPEEIIHIRYPNPVNIYGRGVSPLNAAITSTHLDNQNTSFLNTFFKNAAVPFGLLKSKQRMTDPEVARIKSRLREQYAGSFNWHEVMVLDADAEYQRLGLNLKELEFSVLDFRNEARICSVLNVPPAIAGARVGIQNNTYSNYEEARKSFWEDSLLPLYSIFESGLNNSLMKDFDGRYFMEYDFSSVPALAFREEKLWGRATSGIQSGILTVDEARAMLGYDSLEESSSDEKVKSLRVSAETFEIKESKGKRLFLDINDNDSERDNLEKRHIRFLSAALKKQMETAIDSLPDEGATQEDLNNALQVFRDTENTLTDAIKRMLLEAALFGGRYGFDVVEEWLGVNEKHNLVEYSTKNLEVGTWELVNAQIISWVAEYTFDLIEGLTSTSEDVLRESINTWINDGLNKQVLINTLAPTFGAKRASLIATTEVTRAYARGNIISWQNSGVVTGVQWRTSNDERVCKICGPLGGVRFDSNGDIENVDQETQQRRGVISDIGAVNFIHPGGRGGANRFSGNSYPNPPAHPRCRCFIVPFVD